MGGYVLEDGSKLETADEYIEHLEKLVEQERDAATLWCESFIGVNVDYKALRSACKVWRQATESRLRLVSNREMSDCILPPDAALFEAIDRAEQTDQETRERQP